MRVALIGNPNTGKTTLFNALTGLRQRVGNYPGVTVAKKSGRLTLAGGEQGELIDLPGIYSLAAQSLDERVALDVLCNHLADTPPPDALLVVCDVTNLLRNLFLPSQLAELGIPMVLVLNHMDELRRTGRTVDAELLSKRLGGIPVIPASATKAEGIVEIRAALASLKTNPVRATRLEWPAAVAEAVAEVREAVGADASVTLPDAEIQRILFDAKSVVADRLPARVGGVLDAVLDRARERIRRAGYNPFAVEAVLHYSRLKSVTDNVVTRVMRVERSHAAENFAKFCRQLVAGLLVVAIIAGVVRLFTPDPVIYRLHIGALDSTCEFDIRHLALGIAGLSALLSFVAWRVSGSITRIIKGDEPAEGPTPFIDSVLLDRAIGLLSFALIMCGMFASVFWLAKFPMDGIEAGVDWVKDSVGAWSWLTAHPMLHDLALDGVISGVGAFLVFLPQIFILFLFISLIEDTGYMARAAFLMDKLFSWCGLNGKSFVPMLSGFACAVPSIMGTRTIDDPKARVATAFVTPFMSCSARLPVYTLMIGAFIQPKFGALVATGVMLGMYLVGLAVAIPTAFIVTRFVLKVRPQPFVLEMPRYQMPKARDVLWRMWTNGREFVEKAGTVIFAISVIIWALTYFPHDAKVGEQVKSAYATELAAEKKITPDEALKLIETEPVKDEPTAIPGPADDKAKEIAKAEPEEKPLTPNEVFNERLSGAYMENSYLGRFGKAVQPVFDPAGFDWKITVGVLASFPAREVIVSTLGITYSLGDKQDEESGGLREAMAKSVWQDGPRKGAPIFTIPVVIGIMVFFALCSQCGATLATLAKEAGTRWAVLSFVYMTLLAWFAAVLVYQIGSRL